MSNAIVCLVNEERAAQGRRALKNNRKLHKAAQRHTNVMVQQDCLLHQCPGEPDPGRRIKKVGYFRGATSFTYAENIACDDSAAGAMDQWMASPLHRGNILNRKFKEIGVGASQGQVPSRCADGHGTYTIVFGARKR